MSGKILSIVILASALLTGAAIYYLQVYWFYYELPAEGLEVRLTSLATGAPEPIRADNIRAIDANNSPLSYRACFETEISQAMLTESFVVYEGATPLHGPGWFDCFDAIKIGKALEDERATAYLGQAEIRVGIDRVIAVLDDGRAFVWQQFNEEYQN